MDIIEIGDIDFKKFKEKPIQGSQSKVYDGGDICIKIFNNLSFEEQKEMMRKLREMDGITIDGVLFPLDLIVENGLLKGYTMRNFDDSINMFDFYGSVKEVNCSDILSSIEQASKILRNLHNNNIIVQDLSFDNILINKQHQIMFSDIDGCSYRGYEGPYVSELLAGYLRNNNINKFKISKELDKLSMILSTFQLLFLNEIENVSKRKYKKLSCNINTLKNMEKYYLVKNSLLNEYPYIDELIDKKDDYIINRVKQLSLKGRLLYNLYLKNIYNHNKI